MQKEKRKSKVSSRKKSAAAKKQLPKTDSPPEKPEFKKDRPDKAIVTNELMCPVVGIGASAGGLEALEKFFSNMPPDSGIAFVLVQHLSSTQKSIMGELMLKFTEMKISQIKNKMPIAPNTIYILPSNKDVAIMHRHLYLMEPTESHGLRLPIDYFFRSLAEDRAEKAICIILSGTGTDGTIGLKTINGKGGMAMAQDTESAKFDGMPRSAISTGLVDYILPVEKMPDQLIKYVSHFLFNKERPEKTIIPETINHLEKIFILLRNQMGHDFSHYKKNTICRRIERRMAIHQISDIANYIKYMQQNNQELEILFKELLIGVTNFFRDPEAFDVLKKKVLPDLFKNRQISDTFRVWIPGCSTGEEAFSMAIIFKELMEKTNQNYNIQIFATDIDNTAIETARRGIFPNGIAADVSPERLKRFFMKEDSIYRVKKEIREMIIFAVQDVIKDPPFSKLDLVSCRNLLIYLDAAIQKKILPLFQYTLNQVGFLLLGSSETIGQFIDLYTVIDKKWKIFKRKGPAAHLKTQIEFPIATKADEDEMKYSNKIGNQINNISLHELSDRILLSEYSPSSVIINENFEILHFHGRTGSYLEPAPGEARLNILEMARDGLKQHLSAAIRKVIQQKKEIICKDVRVQDNVGYNIINVTIKPILSPVSIKGMMMVLFEEVTSQKKEKPAVVKHKKLSKTEERISQLEYELQSTKEYLQKTIEELEISNEELKSTNEELQSANEELQSTNEELETSKEELQSLNEELITVNSELENKIAAFTQANNDMNNLLASTDIATIFLDTNLNIVRFTPPTCKIINLIQTDIGRPVSHIVSNLKYEDLVKDVNEVLETLVYKEIEVTTAKGDVYSMRILPYRTVENVIDGVVITFSNITHLVQFEESIQRSRKYAENIVNTIREPLIILDSDMRVVSANKSFYKTFKVSPDEIAGKYLDSIGNKQWDIPKLKRMLIEILPKKQTIEDFKFKTKFPDIGRREIVINARKIIDSEGKSELILLAMEDVTKNTE